MMSDENNIGDLIKNEPVNMLEVVAVKEEPLQADDVGSDLEYKMDPVEPNRFYESLILKDTKQLSSSSRQVICTTIPSEGQHLSPNKKLALCNNQEQFLCESDLMPLDWLYDGRILRSINLPRDNATLMPKLVKDDNDKEKDSCAESLKNMPYHPKKHVNLKPPYSFSCLIFMAIEDSPSKSLPVKEIYEWIENNFPFYKLQSNVGWRNSVRHNLSLNKCFYKMDKSSTPHINKGSLWAVDPEFRPSLIESLRRRPSFLSASSVADQGGVHGSNKAQSSNTSKDTAEAAQSLLDINKSKTVPSPTSESCLLGLTWGKHCEEKLRIDEKIVTVAHPSLEHSYSVCAQPTPDSQTAESKLVNSSSALPKYHTQSGQLADHHESIDTVVQGGWGHEIPLDGQSIHPSTFEVQSDVCTRSTKARSNKSAGKVDLLKCKNRKDSKIESRLSKLERKLIRKLEKKRLKKLKSRGKGSGNGNKEEFDGANALLCLRKGGIK